MKFFETKYRIVHDGEWYKVQEHEWFDVIYGKWWNVGCASTIDGAKLIIETEKDRRNRKGTVVYEE